MLNQKIFPLILLILATLQFSYSKELSDIVPDVPPDAISSKDPLFHEEVLRGIQLTFNDNYKDALVIFDSLITEHPDRPAPYFFKAAAYQNWMSSFRISTFQKEVEENVQLAIDKGEKLLKDDHSAWVRFYIGAAYGYRGFNKFRKHNWIGAYRDGIKGINNFKEALKQDSTLYDVYLGLGSYHYWRTAKSKFIRIIAFWMSDKRELGIRQLKFTMKHGRYAKYEASYVLLTALFDYEKYEQSLEVVNDLIAEKEEPIMTDLYFLGRLQVKFENWSQAINSFQTILTRLEQHKYQSIGYQVECKYWIAKALEKQGKYREGLLLAREGLMQSRNRDADAEMEGHLEEFDEIKDRLEDLHNELNKKYVQSEKIAN